MFTLKAFRNTLSATLSVVLLSALTSTAAQAAANPHPRGSGSYNLTEELKGEVPRHSRSPQVPSVMPSQPKPASLNTPSMRDNAKPKEIDIFDQEQINPLDHPPAPATLGQ
jgi:hypothetical protein